MTLTPIKGAILNMLLLAATVPWPFVFGSEATLGGFPVWAIYSLGASVAYAFCITFGILHYWDRWSQH